MNEHVLACPVCQRPLHQQHTQWSCEQQHHFDQARQGYINLLLPQRKRSKSPGDDKDMVLARQRFLNSGLYQPISDWLNHAVLTHAQHSAHSDHIVDVGCGEGYYSQRLADTLRQHNPDLHLYGIDISKEAVRRATQRSRDVFWLVASGADMPILPNRVDILVSLFTGLMPEGFRPVMAKHGQIFTVNAGAKHLHQLRHILYDNVRESDYTPTPRMGEHFDCLNDSTLTFDIALQGTQQITDLVAMTPHHWRINQAARDRLAQVNELTVTVDVVMHQFAVKTAQGVEHDAH